MSANPAGNLFLDTNVLVYAYDRSAGIKQSIASRLVAGCWENGNGCLSIQVLQEFYVIVTRKIARPLESPVARQIVADLSNWRCHSPSAEDVLQAIDFQRDYQISFWDAMVLQSAARSGCEQLLSEYLGHGQIYGTVQVLNPFSQV